MDAGLDLLLSTVFVTADDLLPERQNNAARSVTDAEVVTGHLFPELLKRSALGDAIQAEVAEGARRIPATSGIQGCTRSRPRTAPRERWNCAQRTPTSDRSA
jgi:hypothetical protein